MVTTQDKKTNPKFFYRRDPTTYQEKGLRKDVLRELFDTAKFVFVQTPCFNS